MKQYTQNNSTDNNNICNNNNGDDIKRWNKIKIFKSNLMGKY